MQRLMTLHTSTNLKSIRRLTALQKGQKVKTWQYSHYYCLDVICPLRVQVLEAWSFKRWDLGKVIKSLRVPPWEHMLSLLRHWLILLRGFLQKSRTGSSAVAGFLPHHVVPITWIPVMIPSTTMWCSWRGLASISTMLLGLSTTTTMS